MSTEPTPSQLVATRKDIKFARAIMGAGSIARKATHWCPDRGHLANTVRAYQRSGWKLLYIVTCQMKPAAPPETKGEKP